MAFDREAARASGYTDEEINAYIAANPDVESKQEKDAQGAAVLPPPDDVIRSSTGEKLPDQPGSPIDTTNANLATLGLAAAAAAPYIGGAALGGLGLYGGSKALSAISTAADAYKIGSQNKVDIAKLNEELQREKIAERAARAPERAARAPAAPFSAPVEPVSSSPILDANGRPIVRPVAPGPVPGSAAAAEARLANLGSYRPGMDRMPAYTGESPFGELGKFSPGTEPRSPGPASQSGGFIDRMMQLANKYAPAAERVTGQVGRALAPLAPVARVLGSAPVMGAQMMLHSGETGPQVPSVGRQRGSEINQLTGRPWTAAELVAYQRNPDAYDRQLAAPQLPR